MSVKKSAIEIYTDGGCEPNPGKGGWAAIILWQNGKEILSGAEKFTTNNRMELTAALNALKKLQPGVPIRIHTDSQYLQKGITEWLPNWKARGWKRRGGSLANLDLWQELDEQLSRLEISWRWVKGHTGNRYNEMADRLAQEQIRK